MKTTRQIDLFIRADLIVAASQVKALGEDFSTFRKHRIMTYSTS